MLTALTPSCSVIIHQTINAENVYLTVTGSVAVAIVLVAAVVVLAITAVVVPELPSGRCTQDPNLS